MLQKFKFEKSFIKMLMSLAIPIILQSLITASLNLLDNVMVGKLGENEIAAVGLSNQFYMIFFYSVAGIGMGASIFMSQLWGKRDVKKIHEFLDLSLLISTVVSVFFAAIAFIFPENIIHIFLKDANVTALGVSYLKIVSVSYIISSITLAYSMALRSTAQTKIPMYGSIVGIIFNGILNYLLIFGKFGFPQMGVSGAALGTTISRVMELSFVLFMIYKFDNIIATKFVSLKTLTLNKFREFFKIASPVIFNDIMWILGISTYSIAYAKLGVNATATMQIAITVNNMFNIFGIGIGVASAIIIGNKIGEGKTQEAHFLSIKISQFGVLLGIIIGVLFYFLSPLVVGVFKITPETTKNVIIVLKIMAVFIPARFYAIIQVIGTLRGGGDVVYAIATEMIGIWVIGVPMAFAAIYFVPGLSITTLYFIICLEELVKCAITYPRVKSYKWIKSLV
ncbi:MATE family efflux transporter [uncultured Cetobacterium sp.]|uniref:MATE family efflux transporter n=1 Tax=uncultured Cetobacterium sp. TaxID=527638 RepID=UPI00260C53FE|nr:MATE family efflux transporter [uncultured Cetobacterium sp.]